MQMNGRWLLCDDGMIRPIIQGAILGHGGQWQGAEFLVDTGADRTVFSAQIVSALQLQPVGSTDQLAGVGGQADSVVVETQVRLRCDDGGFAVFRGHYAAVTQLEALDMSVLGRDITNLFAVIVDRPRDAVCILGQRHQYRIEEMPA